MTYSLKAWTNPHHANDIRIYIQGTTRQSIYFKRAADGRLVWSSKANDTPHKFQTGDHYGKIRKDREAALAVADAFNIKLGDGTGEAEWNRLLQIASTGIVAGDED